ncbi:MAG: hypothetical protein AB1414_07460, partial [bacterium]
VGQAIGDTISGDNIIEAFKEQGIELGKDIYKGTQAWSQMAVQAYQNASNLASYLHLPTPDISIPKDQDAYIKLDIAQELGKTFKSIRETGSDIFTSIRDAVRESRKDYDLRIAYKKGELPTDVLAQKLNNKEINVEDVYQLAVTYGADATKLIALATKNATNQELMQLINKDKGSNKEVSEALKNEREIRIAIHEGEIKAILELANISSPVVGEGAPEPKYDISKLNESDWQKLINSFGNLRQLNYSPTQVGVSTTSFDALKKVCSDIVNTQLEAKEVIRKAIQEVQNILNDANINIASDLGQARAETYIREALNKAGYPSLAAGVNIASLIGLPGTFDPKLLGDPTDVAGLLRRQGKEFIHEMSAIAAQDPYAPVDVYDRLKISVNQSIENYLRSINYEYNFTHGNLGAILVFPDVKFDFESFMRDDYWVEGVKPKQ